MPLLQCIDLVKIYGSRRVVDEASFEVYPGEIVGLLGPNGAGKTTSFRMTIGMIHPTEGKVLLRDQEITRLPMFRRARLGMGYLSQEPSLFQRLTTRNNLLAILETLKISRALGIDEAFFKANDPAGTLKEFNRLYEGDMTGADVAAVSYTEHFTEPDTKTQAILDALPPGAFGVWGKAPEDGLFALFEMEATAAATDIDCERYEQIIGRPVLVLEQSGKATSHEAGTILKILAGTKVGNHSVSPTDEAALTERLKKLKNSA